MSYVGEYGGLTLGLNCEPPRALVQDAVNCIKENNDNPCREVLVVSWKQQFLGQAETGGRGFHSTWISSAAAIGPHKVLPIRR